MKSITWRVLRKRVAGVWRGRPRAIEKERNFGSAFDSFSPLTLGPIRSGRGICPRFPPLGKSSGGLSLEQTYGWLDLPLESLSELLQPFLRRDHLHVV
jgi:hypothetical protein